MYIVWRIWSFIQDLNKKLFYPKPQQDIFPFWLVKNSSSMYKSHGISNLVGTEDTRKRGKYHCQELFDNILEVFVASLSIFGEKEEY
mgnify:CR=1 FL=1